MRFSQGARTRAHMKKTSDSYCNAIGSFTYRFLPRKRASPIIRGHKLGAEISCSNTRHRSPAGTEQRGRRCRAKQRACQGKSLRASEEGEKDGEATHGTGGHCHNFARQQSLWGVFSNQHFCYDVLGLAYCMLYHCTKLVLKNIINVMYVAYRQIMYCSRIVVPE